MVSQRRSSRGLLLRSDDMELNSSVGFNKEFQPRVVYIPVVKIPQELLIKIPTTYDEWADMQEECLPTYSNIQLYKYQMKKLLI
jgi:hypothetical protein